MPNILGVGFKVARAVRLGESAWMRAVGSEATSLSIITRFAERPGSQGRYPLASKWGSTSSEAETRPQTQVHQLWTAMKMQGLAPLIICPLLTECEVNSSH